MNGWQGSCRSCEKYRAAWLSGGTDRIKWLLCPLCYEGALCEVCLDVYRKERSWVPWLCSGCEQRVQQEAEKRFNEMMQVEKQKAGERLFQSGTVYVNPRGSDPPRVRRLITEEEEEGWNRPVQQK